MRRLAAVAFVCGAVSLQAQTQPSSRDMEKEYALGASMAVQVRDSTSPLNIASVTNYVLRLGQELAEEMPGPRRAWSLTVIRDDKGGPTHEPTALPGGYIFVPAGLLVAAQNEAEVAGMLAHSMAHVVHGNGIFKKSGNGSAFSLPSLEIRRQQELRADELAVQAIARAGYDPHALLNYLQRTQPPDPSRSIRLNNLEAAIQKRQVFPRRASSSSFRAVQGEVRNQLVVAEPPEARRIPSLIHPDR